MFVDDVRGCQQQTNSPYSQQSSSTYVDKLFRSYSKRAESRSDAARRQLDHAGVLQDAPSLRLFELNATPKVESRQSRQPSECPLRLTFPPVLPSSWPHRIPDCFNLTSDSTLPPLTETVDNRPVLY